MTQGKLIDSADILKMPTQIALNLFHLNVRVISKKQDDLDLLGNREIDFQMISLTETGCTKESPFFAYRYFKNAALNRTNTCGSGVRMLISPSLNVSVIREHSCSTPDYEMLTLQNEPNIFRVFYHPRREMLLIYFSLLTYF